MIIDFKVLNEALKTFYGVTKSRVGIFDKEGREIHAYPKSLCHLCEKNRKDGKFLAKCLKQDEIAFQLAKQTKSPHFYKCHFGFIEGVFPIYKNKELLGFFMIGQMIEEGDESLLEENLQQSDKKFLKEVPTFDPEKLKSAGTLLEINLSYLLFSEVLQKSEESFYDKGVALMKGNLNCSVEDLMKHLHISRSGLFNLFKGKGESVMGKLNSLRLAKAKKLLLQTEKPISKIADEVFLENNYFSRFFKKETGLSPQNYRKKNS